VTALGVDYRRLWASSAVANLGDGVRLTALPLLAAAITRDPMAISGLTVAADLPWLLVSLFAGALVDRTDRRVLMIRVQVVRTVIAAVLAATVLAGSVQIIVLYALVLVLGVCEVLFDVAAPTMLPRIVARTSCPGATRGCRRRS
jgi:MFS family permease